MNLPSKVSPLASHSFLFMFGMAVMSFLSPDLTNHDPKVESFILPSNVIAVSITDKNKKLITKEILTNELYFLVKKITDDEYCLVSKTKISMRQQKKYGKYILFFKNNNQSYLIAKNLKSIENKMLLKQDHKVELSMCNQRVKVIYGS